MARIVGLDIETDLLRAVCIKTSFRKVEIERYVSIPLHQTEPSESREAELQGALAELSQLLEGQPDVTVCALDGRHVSLRRLSLPKAAEKRAAEVLPFELEPLLPSDVEEVVIDHQPIATDPATQQVELLVATAPHQQVSAAIDQLQRQGIHPRVLCPAPVYLEELAPEAPADGAKPTYMYIELRRDSTEVAILKGERCLVARTLSARFKPAQGGLDQLVRSLKQTIASFRASGAPEPDGIYLAGEGAESHISAMWLSEQLGRPVEQVELPAALAAPDEVVSPAYARAFGLAKRGTQSAKRLNLRQGQFSVTQGKAQWTRYANLAASCLVAVVVALMFSLKAQQSFLMDEHNRLQTQLAATTETVFGTAAPTADAAELLIKQTGNNDPLPRFDALDVLAAISESVAPEITHEVRRLRIEVADDKREGRIELQGMLTTIEQRDAFAAVLEKHPCFKDVEKGKTTSGRGNSYINYQLEAVVQCPGEGSPAKKRRN